jgi:hypothetical protein
VRLAVLLIVLGIALVAFGILFPNFGKTIYPAGTTFPLSQTHTRGPFVNEISIYAGAGITALGVLLATIRLLRR